MAHNHVYRYILKTLAVIFLLAILSACTNDPGTGPAEVEWEHDGCHRCSMILSDQLHAAQIRHSPAGKPSKAYMFDDIGCAVIWLEDKPWKDDPTTEIWVSNHKTNTWIDARNAHYITGHQTPMLYGLGAQPEPEPGSIDFSSAQKHIFAVEEKLKLHGAR